MLKIGYIINSLGYGGVEKYVVDLVNHIDKEKFIPIIFCLQQKGPLRDSIKRKMTIYEIGKRKGNDPILPIRLGRLFRQEDIAIVHSNNWSTFAESVVARWIARAPVMVHIQHGLEMNDAEAKSKIKRYKRNRIRQILSHFTDQIVVVSNATKEFVCGEWGTSEKKVRLVYNGVDLSYHKNVGKDKRNIRNQLGIEKDDLIIGSVGRLMRVKNYTCLIKAFGRVSANTRKVKLLIIGDGPEREELTSLIRELNLGDQTILLGHRPDVKELLTAMDIFVLSSISEGVSIALLEAMACSLPIVATNVGGNPEVIETNKSGLLANSNDPEALSSAIDMLIADPARRKDLGKNARVRVEERFALRRMVDDYERLYLKLYNKKTNAMKNSVKIKLN